MDTDFWLNKWKENNIAFHNSEANPQLVKHFDQLPIAANSRVFLPLCGKTLDIAWLLSKGHRVAGAELSEIAIGQLFDSLELRPEISRAGKLQHYSAKNIDIFVGNIFDLSKSTLGPVDAIYDRAALVALPREVRDRYTAHLTQITNKAPQLIICYEYNQTLMSGPPFSITEQEIHQHYQNSYTLNLIESKNIPGGLKGKCEAKENTWLLKAV